MFVLRLIIDRPRLPIALGVLGLSSFFVSGSSFPHLARELLLRSGRFSLLALAFLPVLWAGGGLCFGTILGCIAGEISLHLAEGFGLSSGGGLFLAAGLSVPLAFLLGFPYGFLLGRVEKFKTAAGFLLALGAEALYSLAAAVFLPRLPSLRAGFLLSAAGDPLTLRLGFLSLPVAALGAAAAVGFLLLLTRKKFEACGRNGDGVRTVAEAFPFAFSAAIAGLGTVIFLRSTAALQWGGGRAIVWLYSAAALLGGGASLRRSGIRNALLGAVLFQLLFLTAPAAGKKLFGSAMTGEYFRIAAAAVITAAGLIAPGLSARFGKGADRDEPSEEGSS